MVCDILGGSDLFEGVLHENDHKFKVLSLKYVCFEKNFMFCRSYGQKIAVVANGEKGDISEIVEKLVAYLATHVRNKQDWLTFC